MRDMIVALIVFGSLPLILWRPYVGVLVWSWLGYMNPHRLTYGFAYNMPFAQIVAVVTITAMIFTREKMRVPIRSLTIWWGLFVLWMNISTLFAITPNAVGEWERSMKIQFIAMVTAMLMTTKKRLIALVWAIAISLGFYGVKGGVFAAATGGRNRVFGPDMSFIADNNTLALALIMTLPLMWYLHGRLEKKWMRWAMLGAIAATGLAILASQSRGALLAGSAMVFVLWIKSKRKVVTGMALAVALAVMIPFMPDTWFERMETIQTYDEDASAMGRINAWWFAYYLALDNPFAGGGFGTFTPRLFLKYAPVPTDFHDAHSIYFEVLAEQGFVGLFIFLGMGLSALLTGQWVIRHAKKHAELHWAADLAAMVQVSLVGYAVGGAFLGLAYFDLYYHFIVILILLKTITMKHIAAETAGDSLENKPDDIAPEQIASERRV